MKAYLQSGMNLLSKRNTLLKSISVLLRSIRYLCERYYENICVEWLEFVVKTKYTLKSISALMNYVCFVWRRACRLVSNIK